jgi:hypothetical protein
MLRLQPAEERDAASLRNWVEATGCLAREETAYLAHHSELVSLAPMVDSTVVQVETWVEAKLIQYWQGFRAVSIWRKGVLLSLSWLTDIDSISRPLGQPKRIHLWRSFNTAHCKVDADFSNHVSLDDASRCMQSYKY